jgi:hypothetical protein
MTLPREATHPQATQAGSPARDVVVDPVRTAVMWAVRPPQGSPGVVPPPLPPQDPVEPKGARPPQQSSPGVVPPPLPPQEQRGPSPDPNPFDDDPTEVVSAPVLAARAAASRPRDAAEETRGKPTAEAATKATVETVAKSAMEASARSAIEASIRTAIEASTRAMIDASTKTAVDMAMVPLTQVLSEILRRVEELERRAQAAPAMGYGAMPPARAAMPSYQAIDPGGISRVTAVAPKALDIRAIERDTSIVVDGALDGRNRRLKLILTFVFALIAVFAGLGFALIKSYAPQSH